MVEDKAINQEIGNRVKKRRQELGLSQDDLAKRLGYQYRSAVSKLEKGGTVFKQALLMKVAKALIKKLQFILSIFALFLSVLALFSVVFKNFYTIFYTTKKRGPKASICSYLFNL